MSDMCYCKEIEQARGLSASLCLNWEMPRCPAHQPRREKECECICHKDHKCECGSWVKTRDPQKTSPAPEPEKCQGEHGIMCTCMQNRPTPKDFVEEKIEDILIKRMGLGQELRELVELARSE